MSFRRPFSLSQVKKKDESDKYCLKLCNLITIEKRLKAAMNRTMQCQITAAVA